SPTFSPDNDGFEDILQISYQFNKAGMIANATIFSDEGIPVRRLLKNFTLDSAGVFVWDGLDDQNSMAGVGIYILYAEIFDADGTVKKFRKPFVLAAKF